jgi:hypothetical protein
VKMKTALMLAGGVGLVGYLIYRARTAPAVAPLNPGPAVRPGGLVMTAKANTNIPAATSVMMAGY